MIGRGAVDVDASTQELLGISARADRLLARVAVASVGVVVAIAVLTGYWSMQLVDRQGDVAQLVDMAGQQRLLTQRVETHVSALADPTLLVRVQASIRAELLKDTEQIERVSRALQYGDPALGLQAGASPVAVRLYSPAGLDLAHRIAEFAAAARVAAVAPFPLARSDDRAEAIHSRAAGLLLGDLTALSEALADDGRRQVEQLHRNIVVGMGMVGVTAVAEVFGVLWPLLRRSRRRRALAVDALLARQRATTLVETVVMSIDVGVIALDLDGDVICTNPVAHTLLGIDPRSPMSRTVLTPLLVSAAEAATTEEPGSPAVVRGRVERLLAPEVDAEDVGLMTHSTDGRRVEVRARRLRNVDGTRFGTVLVAHDVTTQHQRHTDLARHAAQLTAIGEAARALIREQDPRGTVCRVACEVVGATIAGLYEPDGHGDLVCTAAAGVDLLGMRMPLNGRSMTAQTFHHATATVVGRMAQDDAVDHQVVERLSEMAGRDLVSGAFVPVISRGRCCGVISLGFTVPKTAVTAQLPVLDILAAEVAVALERQDLLQQLSDEATHDALTGAGNRRHWEDQLPQAVDRASRTGDPLTVLVIDFDHFKAFNDAHGHPAGDALLRQSVQAWTRRLRPGDLLCRYGGEEFAVLLHRCDIDDAVTVAEDLRAVVPTSQTCSIGVATWSDAETGHELLARADEALYAAKDQGRDRVMTSARARL